jgi:hypothetical protein
LVESANMRDACAVSAHRRSASCEWQSS